MAEKNRLLPRSQVNGEIIGWTQWTLRTGTGIVSGIYCGDTCRQKFSLLIRRLLQTGSHLYPGHVYPAHRVHFVHHVAAKILNNDMSNKNNHFPASVAERRFSDKFADDGCAGHVIGKDRYEVTQELEKPFRLGPFW